MLLQLYDTMGDLIRQLDEMLEAIGSGDEKRLEGGEGLKGDEQADLALSGVKLYKGETLLELTERWRFIYDRLCTVDDDDQMRFEYVIRGVPDFHLRFCLTIPLSYFRYFLVTACHVSQTFTIMFVSSEYDSAITLSYLLSLLNYCIVEPFQLAS